MPFVTFEGVEGCGKSTQLARAAEALRSGGREVLATREPGGSDIGRKIRDILMDVGHRDLEPAAEWLLLEADRAQHVVEVLKPALEAGAFVLCDRYSDSTEAYQVRGRGVDPDAVRLVDAIARAGLGPELTLLYDMDPALGLERARRRDKGSGRFESAEMAFHERVRTAFLDIARREPGRVVVISADREAEEVFSSTWDAISKRFRL
ncbi:MAG TPA: dTMP kinase [Thermoanaerobaculia bacterium]